MAIAKDNTGANFNIAGGQTTQSTNSFAVAGANRFLAAFVFSGAGSAGITPSAVKWGGSGGTAMTQRGSTLSLGSFWSLSCWTLTAPTAQTSTVYADYGVAVDESSVIATSFTGVHQSVPLGTVTSKTNNFAGSVTIDLNTREDTLACTTISGDMMVDCIGVGTTGGSNPTISINGGQTSDQEYEGGTLSAYDAHGSSHLLASGTTTNSIWRVVDTTQNAVWGMFALPLKQAGAGVSAAVLSHYYNALRSS